MDSTAESNKVVPYLHVSSFEEYEKARGLSQSVDTVE